MSSAASRQRQRQRRRARGKLWAAQALLAERQVDLVSYDRVIADMDKRYRDRELALFTGGQAIALVTELRDATKGECEKLRADVKVLEIACKKLEPKDVSP